MTQLADVDVLIVGLGPVGAVAGNLLGQFGHQVLIVDQTDGAGLRPRAGGLDDENLRLLQNIGLAEEFLKTSQPLVGAQMVSSYIPSNDDGLSPYDPSLEEPMLLNGMQASEGVGVPGMWPPVPDMFWPGRNGYPLGARGFYQPKFEEILRRGLERFSNVKILLSTCCVGLKQNDTHVVVTLQSVSGSWVHTPGNELTFKFAHQGETCSIKCKFVIGCDGARSVVRKAMGGIGMVSLQYDERWWACDVKLLRPDSEIFGTKLPYFSQLIADPRRSYTIVPLWQVSDSSKPGRHVRFDIQVAPTDQEKDMQSPDKIRHLISPWLQPEDYELIRFAIYRFWSLLADKWRCHRIFLAGDACHTMPPFLGQGMNQGLKDVNNLCWKLSAVLRGIGHLELLDSYEKERKPLVKDVVEGSLEVGRLMEGMKLASRLGHKALMDAARGSKGRGLESGLLLANTKLRQYTDESSAYPRLLSKSAKDAFTGRTLPQIRLVERGAGFAPVLLDDLVWANKKLGFVLLAVSHNGARPNLSSRGNYLLDMLCCSVFNFALHDSASVIQDCKYHVAAGEPFQKLDVFAPLAALVRPDRFVLACTKLDYAEQLLEEIAQYLFGNNLLSKL